jgi:hypothetical protein
MLNSKNSFQIDAPLESVDFVAWTKTLMDKIELQAQLEISNPVSHLYSMKQFYGEQEIYFFVNSDRKKAVEFEATFKTGNKVPYLWIPSTGERFALSYKEKNKLHISLQALESALIIYEPAKIDLPEYQFQTEPSKNTNLETTWDVKFEHINGTVFNRKMEQLIDFASSDDEALQTFAGTITYSTQIENSSEIKYLKLTEVNEAVTELFVNGNPVGMRWYGNHNYDVSDLLVQGTNQIEIKLTNTLANYCKSLSDNPTAQEWTKNYKTPFPAGLEGVSVAY